jgi:tRNA 5-methylaminomethyl-2-thiouridine biosynthesis bifunctional protein
MPARLTAPTVAWQDGALWSVDFADAYASRTGARAEREHVFLRGHGFAAEGDAAPGRWVTIPRRARRGGASPWVFGELGFGAGVAFLATWAALRRHGMGAHLEWVSVEHAPLAADLLRRAALADPAMAPLEPLVRELAAAWPERVPGIHRRALEGGRVRLTLLFGGVVDALPVVPFLADAWNLDGFAPARNPEMWADAALAQVAQHAGPGSTLATFSASGAVRRALAESGWTVRAAPGAPGKREMTVGVRAGADAGGDASADSDAGAAAGGNASAHVAPALAALEPPQRLPAWFALPDPVVAEEAIVIGAGLAGAAAARALAERGVRVQVLEAGRVASGGSGAPHALLAPHVARWEGPQCRIVAQAFLHARAAVARLGVAHTPCGVLRLVPEDEEWGVAQTLETWGWPAHMLGVISAAEATSLAGTEVRSPAVWVPDACVLRPADLVRALLDHPGVSVHEGVTACALRRTAEAWHVTGAASGQAWRAPCVVVATAGAWTPVWEGAAVHPRVDRSAPLAREALPEVPLDGTRGQLTLLACPRGGPGAALLAGGFVLPAGSGVCVGATHERGSDDLAPTTHDDAENLGVLSRLAQGLLDSARVPERTGRWAGLRATVHDHCPVVGPVPDSPAFLSAFGRLRHGPLAERWPRAPTQPGLFATLAHGGRGTGTALLAGELLADIALGGVRCVGDDLLPALLPQRFAVRALRRAGDSEVA